MEKKSPFFPSGDFDSRIAEVRRAVVEEAHTWLRTPFHLGARVKGAGVDCQNLVADIYERTGVPLRIEVPSYPSLHLFMNSSREIPPEHIFDVMREVSGPPRPGDLALFEFYRSYVHASIIVEWPTVIHAHHSVTLADVRNDPFLLNKNVKFLTPRRWLKQ